MVRLDAGSTLDALLEAMDHGRDGYPRWIVVESINARDAAREAERIDGSASRQGFVPLGVDVYMRRRILGDSELDERTLLLVDTRGEPSRAHAALLHAAAHSPRPHVLLTLRGSSRQQRIIREARAAYVPQVATRDSHHVA